jgi:hypothetical protein
MQRTKGDYKTVSLEKKVPLHARVYINNKGFWYIDGKKGKNLCILEITLPDESVSISFAPSHPLQDDIMENILEAELRNDFTELDLPRRKCTRDKIERYRRILDKYEFKIKEMEA